MFEVIFTTVFLLVFLRDGEKWQVDLKESKSSDFTFIPDEFWSTDFNAIIMPSLTLGFNSDGTLQRVLQLHEDRVVVLNFDGREVETRVYALLHTAYADKAFNKAKFDTWVDTLPKDAWLKQDEELNRDLS